MISILNLLGIIRRDDRQRSRQAPRHHQVAGRAPPPAQRPCGRVGLRGHGVRPLCQRVTSLTNAVRAVQVRILHG
jgi:hypothetical protein